MPLLLTNRQLEVSLCQSVQIQLRKQSAQLLRPPREQRQHPTLEPLLDAPNPRASECDRARAHRQPPRQSTDDVMQGKKSSKFN